MKAFVVIVVTLFFLLRDWACYHFFPEMKVDAKEWDGSNNLTMNTFHVIILMLLGLCRALTLKDSRFLIFTLDVVIGLVGSDVFKRLFFGITCKEPGDTFEIFAVVFMLLIDYVYGERIKKWLLKYKLIQITHQFLWPKQK